MRHLARQWKLKIMTLQMTLRDALMRKESCTYNELEFPMVLGIESTQDTPHWKMQRKGPFPKSNPPTTEVVQLYSTMISFLKKIEWHHFQKEHLNTAIVKDSIRKNCRRRLERWLFNSGPYNLICKSQIHSPLPTPQMMYTISMTSRKETLYHTPQENRGSC